MNAALTLARTYGVAVGFADLGDWGATELCAEYDPKGPFIRLNARVAEGIAPGDLGTFVTVAIGHELYHHRERIGEIPVIGNRAARERAADRYARELLEQST